MYNTDLADIILRVSWLVVELEVGAALRPGKLEAATVRSQVFERSFHQWLSLALAHQNCLVVERSSQSAPLVGARSTSASSCR